MRLTLCVRMRRNGMKIGERIKEVFEAMPKSCTVNWFAEQLHCDRRNIYRIFAKDNIDIELLARISIVLNHDFFKDLSETCKLYETKSDTKDAINGHISNEVY